MLLQFVMLKSRKLIRVLTYKLFPGRRNITLFLVSFSFDFLELYKLVLETLNTGIFLITTSHIIIQLKYVRAYYVPTYNNEI